MNLILYGSLAMVAFSKPWRAMVCNFLDMSPGLKRVISALGCVSRTSDLFWRYIYTWNTMNPNRRWEYRKTLIIWQWWKMLWPSKSFQTSASCSNAWIRGLEYCRLSTCCLGNSRWSPGCWWLACSSFWIWARFSCKTTMVAPPWSFVAWVPENASLQVIASLLDGEDDRHGALTGQSSGKSWAQGGKNKQTWLPCWFGQTHADMSAKAQRT